MGFVLGLLAVVAVLASVLLMFVILLQEPKGGGLAAALGGSGMDAIGANVGQVNRFTSWVAGIWIGACLLHAMFQPVGVDVTAAGKKPAPGETSVEKPATPENGGPEQPLEGTR
jgi:protein translocase SecG subunit